MANRIYSDIAVGFDSYFIKALEGDRKVLRCVFPDEHEILSNTDECKPYYKKQLVQDLFEIHIEKE